LHKMNSLCSKLPGVQIEKTVKKIKKSEFFA